MEETQLNVIEPGDEQYAELQEQVNAVSGRIDYNSIAESYNKAKCGAVIIMTMRPEVRIDNMKRVLNNRGLVSGSRSDYTLTRMLLSANGTRVPSHKRLFALTKRSEEEMRVV